MLDPFMGVSGSTLRGERLWAKPPSASKSRSAYCRYAALACGSEFSSRGRGTDRPGKGAWPLHIPFNRAVSYQIPPVSRRRSARADGVTVPDARNSAPPHRLTADDEVKREWVSFDGERQMNDQQTKQGPAMKFKGGSIEAAIFENQKDGKTWHNVSIIRRTEIVTVVTRSTSTHAYADLVQVARIAEQAECWIAARLQELGTLAPVARPGQRCNLRKATMTSKTSLFSPTRAAVRGRRAD